MSRYPIHDLRSDAEADLGQTLIEGVESDNGCSVELVSGNYAVPGNLPGRLGRATVAQPTQKLYPHGRRGMASMHPDLRRQIASKGGKRAHELGVAHEWTSAEASAVGVLGGKASVEARRKRKAKAATS